MPDFVCYRNGEFKFVECKFKHEPLSKKQKKCIKRLQKMGFKVEIHKLVGPETKAREIEQINGKKFIKAKQLAII